ncbi:MAG: polysaccharide deacetylase family protein [Patescibacteria group bacterium]
MDVLKKTVKYFLLALRDVLNPFFNFKEVAVLCYHQYDPHLPAQLAALKARGYSFVPLADVVAWAKGKGAVPHKAVSITLDDGYPDFVPQVLPVMRQYGAPVTLFATGAYDTTPIRGDVLVELGYHTASHPNLAKLSGAELIKEIAPPRGERYFAYPGGNHSPEAAAAVRAAGYQAAFTIRPVPVRQGVDPYYVPRSVITPDMSVRDVLFYTSRAACWYKALTDLV